MAERDHPARATAFLGALPIGNAGTMNASDRGNCRVSTELCND